MGCGSAIEDPSRFTVQAQEEVTDVTRSRKNRASRIHRRTGGHVLRRHRLDLCPTRAGLADAGSLFRYSELKDSKI